MDFLYYLVLLLVVGVIDRDNAHPAVIDLSTVEGNYNQQQRRGDGHIKYIQYPTRQLEPQTPVFIEDEFASRQSTPYKSPAKWEMRTVLGVLQRMRVHFTVSRNEGELIAASALQNIFNCEHESGNAVDLAVQYSALKMGKKDMAPNLVDVQLRTSSILITASLIDVPDGLRTKAI